MTRTVRCTLQLPGPLIQVMDDLAPGDKVIVTDISKWADSAQAVLSSDH
jgi:hypothetical protein